MEKTMRDSLAAVARTNSDAPHGPDRQVVDVGDLRRPRERELRARSDGGPAGHLVTLVRQDSGCDVTFAQRPDERAACGSDELPVGPRVDPVAQTPAHRRTGPLGAEHDRDVIEPLDRRRLHLAHHDTSRPDGRRSNMLAHASDHVPRPLRPRSLGAHPVPPSRTVIYAAAFSHAPVARRLSEGG